MKNLLLFTLLFTLLCCGASAQSKEFPYDSGNAFLRLCSSAEKDQGTLTDSERQYEIGCMLYIAGFVDGVETGWAGTVADTKQEKLPKPFCRPPVEHGQMVKIVLKYVRENPEFAHQDTKLLALFAFQKAFPCPSK